MSAEKIDLLGLSVAELEHALSTIGQPAYRAPQIYGWLYRSLVPDFAGMGTLPRPLREELAERCWPPRLATVAEQSAIDGQTTKTLLALRDGQSVEAVLMRQGDLAGGAGRRSICVSSQVGCPVGCTFCATGQSGFVRNLTAGEMVAQVLHFAAGETLADGQRPISSVVFMGQGEPLLNLAQTRKAIEILNAPEGFNLGARHITISTAGVVPGIRALATWPLQVGLAVSLHAPDDSLRSSLVPLNRRYPVAALVQACRDYSGATGRRVTFEYTVIEGLNDSPEQARALALLLRDQLAHVNLIPLNASPASSLRPARRGRVLAMQAELQRAGIACTVRVERGADIDAACGQLRQRQANLPGSRRGKA